MKIVLFTITALFLINPASSFAQVTTVTNANPGIGNILVVGDSLANGFRATDKKVKPAGCLAANFDHSKMINVSVPGLTSEQILKAVNKVKSKNPKLVFVSSGGNDTLHDDKKPGSYPPAQTFKEMNEMFDTLLATGAVVVYLGLNPPAPYPIRLPDIWKIATDKGVIVADGMDGLWEDPTLMADKHHPNNAGYAIMCRRIVAATQGYYP